VKSILERVTILAGEKTTRLILHQIEREMDRTTFNYPEDEPSSHHLLEVLDDALHRRKNP
jgi:hypothetical protein